MMEALRQVAAPARTALHLARSIWPTRMRSWLRLALTHLCADRDREAGRHGHLLQEVRVPGARGVPRLRRHHERPPRQPPPRVENGRARAHSGITLRLATSRPPGPGITPLRPAPSTDGLPLEAAAHPTSHCLDRLPSLAPAGPHTHTHIPHSAGIAARPLLFSRALGGKSERRMQTVRRRSAAVDVVVARCWQHLCAVPARQCD